MVPSLRSTSRVSVGRVGGRNTWQGHIASECEPGEGKCRTVSLLGHCHSRPSQVLDPQADLFSSLSLSAPFLSWHLSVCHCLPSVSLAGGSTSPFSSPITSDEEYLSPPEEFPEPGETWPQSPTMKLSPSQNRRTSDTGSKAPPTFKVRPLSPASAPWAPPFLRVTSCSRGHTRLQYRWHLAPLTPFTQSQPQSACGGRGLCPRSPTPRS